MQTTFFLTLLQIFFFTLFTSIDIEDVTNLEQVQHEYFYNEEHTDTTSLYTKIYEAEEVVLELSSNIKTIRDNFKKGNATEGFVGVNIDGETYKFSTSFKLGGKSRRKICKMPPVKLNLKKNDLYVGGFNKNLDKTKIVFQCTMNKSMAESIKMEKLLYDMYAVVSTYARRSKIVKVKIDEEKKPINAFLLEDDDDFEYRTHTEIIKNKTIATNVLNREEYVTMCLFQFMIANADWSARRGHNTDLYRRMEDNSLIIVPYDFDYSGIINNNYAVPPENLPIQHVTQRHFMDKDVPMEELFKGIDHYIEHEELMLRTVDDAYYLAEGSRKRIHRYVAGFYDIIRNEKKVKKMIKK